MRLDKLTLLGIALAALALFGGNSIDGGRPAALLHLAAFVIVGFGTLAATLLSTSLPVLRRSLQMAVWCLRPPLAEFDPAIKQTVALAKIARQEGVLALDSRSDRLPDEFMRLAVRYLVDGADPDTLRRSLELEIQLREDRDYEAIRVFQAAGGYAPTIGILGAVIGLIQVLENMSDPASIGPGIATAFVATVYGVGFANLIFLPIAAKLKVVMRTQVQRLEMITDGVLGIAEGRSPKLIEARMRSYGK